RRIDPEQDMEDVGSHASGERAGQDNELVYRRSQSPERVSLRRVGGLRLMDLVGNAVSEKRAQITADEFDWRVPPDLGLVGLPQRTIQRPACRIENLAETLFAVEIRSEEPAIVIDDHWQTAIGI